MDLKKFRFKPGVEVTNREIKRATETWKFVVSQLDDGTLLSYTRKINHVRWREGTTCNGQ